jgi:hypothetical protein
MTPDYRALCAELLSLLDKLAMRDPEMDGGLLRHRTRTLLAQPEPVATEGRWSEGVCGDGAAILKDGVMQPIEDVIAALNATALAQPEPVAPKDEAWFANFAAWLAREMPAGTVIGDPLWWAPRIARAVLQRYLYPTP